MRYFENEECAFAWETGQRTSRTEHDFEIVTTLLLKWGNRTKQKFRFMNKWGVVSIDDKIFVWEQHTNEREH